MAKLIKVNFFGEEFELSSNSNNLNNIIHVHRIVKRILPRRGYNIINIISNKKKLLKCRICNKIANFNILYSVKIIDNIIYYQAYDVEYEKLEKYLKLYCGSCLKKYNYNANSKIYVSNVYGVSIEEANRLILERNSSPFYAHNHKNEEEYKNWQKRDKNFYIKKYGKEKGLELFKKNINKFIAAGQTEEANKMKDSMSLTYFLNKYEDKKLALKKYIERKDSVKLTLPKYIERHGEEEGKKLYKKRIEHLRYLTTVESYIERYGKKEGEKRHEEWRQKIAITPENMIRKYGKEEGEKRYKKWLIGITNYKKFFYSNESFNFFKKIENKIPNLEIKYGDNEWFIWDKERNFNNQYIYFYDAYIPKLNLIIEYDTPVFHPNPNYLAVDELKRSRGSFEKDLYKEKLAKENGYEFYRVFVKNRKTSENELSKLINYINENR